MAEKPKRPTLADHQASITNLVSSVEHLAADVAEIKAPSTRDFEADVAGRCARALDALKDRTSSRSSSSSDFYNLQTSGYGGPSSYPYQPLYAPPSGPVPRVLDYLRQRYGIPDPSTEAQRLSGELQRAYQRIGELEGRLEQIRGASA